ncbi:MAG: hypothetical protein WD898_01275 [Candidatus Paceibacterota bacterium]
MENREERAQEIRGHMRQIKILLRIIGFLLTMVVFVYLFFKWSENIKDPALVEQQNSYELAN